MEKTKTLTYAMLRAKAEAAVHKQEVHPEHLFMGLLKLAEMSADKITSSANDLETTAADMLQVATLLKNAGIDPPKVRVQLRRILAHETPAGDGKALLSEIFADAADAGTLSASRTLSALLDKPTCILSEIINTGKNANTPSSKNVTTSGNLTFLPDLTARIRRMRYVLLGRMYGQDHVVHAFAEGMFNAELLAAADDSRKRPRAVFVFVGPVGVGKKLLARQAAEILAIPYKRFDMSNFADSQAHFSLTGYNPTYRDAKEGALTGFVRENPHRILLFSEIEKAHPDAVKLFLQILDSGSLHDDFLDEDVTFRDAVIIFTTCAGRQLCESYGKSGAAGLSRRTILHALEAELNPHTGAPCFPASICSRIAAGCLFMFNQLQGVSLEKVITAEFQRCCALFEKQYGVKVQADRLLATVLLFAEGAQIDVRSLRAQTAAFFKTAIFKLFRIFERGLEQALHKLESIRFEVVTTNLPDEVKPLFKNPEHRALLFFGNSSTADKLRAILPETEFYSAATMDAAMHIMCENDIYLVIIELSAKRSRNFFKILRERLPEMPLYLLESGKMTIDDDLFASFRRAGAGGKLTLYDDNHDLVAEEIAGVVARAYLQSVVETLAMQHKTLSFKTSPTLSHDRTTAVVRLGDFALRRIAAADENRELPDDAEHPETRFDDVIGANEAKTELMSFVKYLKNTRKAAISGYKPPKGILLYGHPGTGKTMLARAIAGESDIMFIPATASNLVSKMQSGKPDAVRNLFARARRCAPAIIFIDEIDVIGRTRGKSSAAGRGEEVALSALLDEMDSLSADAKHPVFVLAATNFDVEENRGGSSIIDPTLTRRFEKKILVDLPNKDDRERYLIGALKKQPTNGSANMLRQLAERSTGYSIANLETVLELGQRLATRREQTLDDKLIEEAFELNRHGEKKNWGKEYLERVARHESGHACLSYLSGKTPSYLTIVARGSHGGYMEHADDENSPLKTKDELLARVRITLGGRAAEIVYYGDKDGISSGASGDLQHATRILRTMLCTYGMDEETGMATLTDEEATKGPMAEKITARISAILKEQLDLSVSLIRENKPRIDGLVSKLLANNKLTKDEIDVILKKII
jgi:ATP-dependent Zn protease